MYHNDNGNWFSLQINYSGCTAESQAAMHQYNGSPSPAYVRFWSKLASYCGHQLDYDASNWPAVMLNFSKSMRCPASTTQIPNYWSFDYCVNYYLFTDTPYKSVYHNGTNQAYADRILNGTAPYSRIIMHLDGRNGSHYILPTSWNNPASDNAIQASRHSKGNNITFADGHVEHRTVTNLLTGNGAASSSPEYKIMQMLWLGNY